MRIELLDHGYLEIVETWGSDERIVEAARMSTGRGFLGWGPLGYQCNHTGCGWKGQEGELIRREVHDIELTSCPRCGDIPTTTPGDEKLLGYLYDNKHATPFEMAGAVFEVQAPIFVFREWHRHRTQSYNELSARYTPLPDVNYVPNVERLMMNAGTSNKQAGTVKGSEALTEVSANIFRAELAKSYVDAQLLYDWALNAGVPKELARAHLPVGRYSRMRASANLRNWMAFLTLRMASGAQWEIRQYANAVAEELRGKFPRTCELFLGAK